jgi:cell division protein FtsW
VASLIGVAGVALVGLIAVAPYRFARITTFINPDIDPQGAGYQIKQAFIAIGSGGIFGRGFGLSRAKFQYLPEAAGDSVFAIAAEELGFIVALAIVFLFTFILLRGITVAKQVSDPFGQLLIGGILIWIVGQAFVNIGALVGVFPLTGIPLPFISYGGTSLAALLTGVGIMLNVSKSSKA